MTSDVPLIIAHRGGKYWESDDFSYIAESVHDGVDIIELDIRIRDRKYLIQHMPWDKVQGTLEDALNYVGRAKLYLDIKGHFDINDFISYVRSLCDNEIIIGSFDLKTLADIKDENVIKNCHCLIPWTMISRGTFCQADWINPICYVTTESLAKEIKKAGFKFVPSGNQIFQKNEIVRNQLKYAEWGAHAISTHHVKEMRLLLK